MSHKAADSTTPIYTSTRVPPAKTSDRPPAQIEAESREATESVAVTRMASAAPQYPPILTRRLYLTTVQEDPPSTVTKYSKFADSAGSVRDDEHLYQKQSSGDEGVSPDCTGGISNFSRNRDNQERP